ncbi:MAG: peptidase T [Saprospiraceae bacterium]|nr:peptidase T [Saprospiraceae bacterium]MBK7788492.1 peptidase T [Saprospiraceae bacterium]
MQYTVRDRFLRYVQVDTEADPLSATSPSSEKQKRLTEIILEELAEMGIKAQTNESGYIYASLPSNCGPGKDKVFFCAHLDTAPDCSGKDVKPIVHSDYQGQDLVLPDDTTQVLTSTKYPALKNKIGHDLITASGLTLLGSDDKSGVAIIVDAFYQMLNNPNLPHGEVKMLLTTDEEIGRGVAHVDLDLLDADYGYTLDGGDLGSIEFENFSANKAVIDINGVSAHPGYAKGKMENAIKIASEIVAHFPKDSLCPEATDGMQGFIHPNSIEGKLESAKIELILRDFVTSRLDEQKDYLDKVCKKVMESYPNSTYHITVTEQYRNMKDILDQHPKVMDLALRAVENIGVTPKSGAIRGGTDGAVLSHKGLPCPNLFAGEQAIHSKHEWVSVQDMQKAVDMILEICKLAVA